MFFKKYRSRIVNNREKDISPINTERPSDEKSLYYEYISNSLKLIDLEKELQSGLESAIVYKSQRCK